MREKDDFMSAKRIRSFLLTLVHPARLLALLEGFEVVLIALAPAVAEDVASCLDVVEIPPVDVAFAGSHVFR